MLAQQGHGLKGVIGLHTLGHFCLVMRPWGLRAENSRFIWFICIDSYWCPSPPFPFPTYIRMGTRFFSHQLLIHSERCQRLSWKKKQRLMSTEPALNVRAPLPLGAGSLVMSLKTVFVPEFPRTLIIGSPVSENTPTRKLGEYRVSPPPTAEKRMCLSCATS